MTTYTHDNTTFTPAQIFQGVRLVKGKICSGFYSNEKNTRTVIPTIIKAPKGELHGFYYGGGLDKTKKLVLELLNFGAKIENEVIVIDASQFAHLMDGSFGHFRMWEDDAQVWATSGVNDFRWNSTTRKYEYTPKEGE